MCSQSTEKNGVKSKRCLTVKNKAGNACEFRYIQRIKNARLLEFYQTLWTFAHLANVMHVSGTFLQMVTPESAKVRTRRFYNYRLKGDVPQIIRWRGGWASLDETRFCHHCWRDFSGREARFCYPGYAESGSWIECECGQSLKMGVRAMKVLWIGGRRRQRKLGKKKRDGIDYFASPIGSQTSTRDGQDVQLANKNCARSRMEAALAEDAGCDRVSSQWESKWQTGRSWKDDSNDPDDAYAKLISALSSGPLTFGEIRRRFGIQPGLIAKVMALHLGEFVTLDIGGRPALQLRPAMSKRDKEQFAILYAAGKNGVSMQRNYSRHKRTTAESTDYARRNADLVTSLFLMIRRPSG